MDPIQGSVFQFCTVYIAYLSFGQFEKLALPKDILFSRPINLACEESLLFKSIFFCDSLQ